jgi:thioredoxin 1
LLSPKYILFSVVFLSASLSFGQVVITSDDNFKNDVVNSKVPVLLDFWATWCGPCRMYGPVLDEIAKEYGKKLKVYRVNVDENPSLSQQFNISAIPMSIIFKKGKIVKGWSGYVPLAMVQDQLKKTLKFAPESDTATTH